MSPTVTVNTWCDVGGATHTLGFFPACYGSAGYSDGPPKADKPKSKKGEEELPPTRIACHVVVHR